MKYTVHFDEDTADVEADDVNEALDLWATELGVDLSQYTQLTITNGSDEITVQEVDA